MATADPAFKHFSSPGRVGGLLGQCCAALEAPRGPEGTSWPRGRIPPALNTLRSLPAWPSYLPSGWMAGKVCSTLVGSQKLAEVGGGVHYRAGAKASSFSFFLAVLHGIWNLSSLTRD